MYVYIHVYATYVTAVSVKIASYSLNMYCGKHLCLNVVDVKCSPVVRANGIQNILDPILPLHALLAFVYHRRQVLHMGFGRKRILLSSPFSLTFRNVKPI